MALHEFPSLSTSRSFPIPAFTLTEASVVKCKDLGNGREPPQTGHGSGQWRLEFGHKRWALNNIWAPHWCFQSCFLFPRPLRNIEKSKSWWLKLAGKNVWTHFQRQAQLPPKLGPQALTLSFLMICSKLGMRKPIFLRCSCPKRLAWCRTTLTHPTCHPNLRRMLKSTIYSLTKSVAQNSDAKQSLNRTQKSTTHCDIPSCMQAHREYTPSQTPVPALAWQNSKVGEFRVSWASTQVLVGLSFISDDNTIII